MTSRLQVYPRMRLLVMLTQKSLTVSVLVACYCTIEVFKKICVNAKHSQSTEDNYETNFLKIGLLWPVGGRTGRLILSWSGSSEGIAAAACRAGPACHI